MILDIQALMTTLARVRTVFHSEADFQHALAWQLHQQRPSASIRLELPLVIADRRVHVDVWASDGDQRVAIELKYFTRSLLAVVDGERFELKDQGAQDLGRYDVLKDLWRVESLVGLDAIDRGYVIALTNDSAYWSGPRPMSSPNYEAFRLFEGRVISGALGWGPNTGAGTMRGREAAIQLSGTYACSWYGYSRVPTPRYGLFQYLLFEVGRRAEEGRLVG